VKIAIEPGSFADAQAEQLCRRRLAAVLARYADLVGSLTVAPIAVGLRVEVCLAVGVSIAVEQAEVEGHAAILHLADRIGRAVARRVDLGANPATARLFESSKRTK
jgi:hypothetical protein